MAIFPESEEALVSTMELALSEAEKAGNEGNVAVGAVLLRGEQVIRGHNEVKTSFDPSAHAEMVAIREVARASRTADLSDWTLCTTFEPCPMCGGAIVASGIRRVIVGAQAWEDGFMWHWGEYRLATLLRLAGVEEYVQVTWGVMADACVSVRREWEGN